MLYVQNDKRGIVVPATAKVSGIKDVAGSLGPSDLPLIQNRDIPGGLRPRAHRGRSRPRFSVQDQRLPGPDVHVAGDDAPPSDAVSPSVSLSAN